MKVLWFCNTPCLAAETLGLDIQIGGWLASLERQITDDATLDLHISFYHPDALDPFRIGNTTYHPVVQSRTIVDKIRSRLDGFQSVDIRDVTKLRTLVDAVSPDLVHVHGTEENFGLVASYLQIPVIVSLQGILGPYREHLFSGIPEAYANSWSGLGARIMDRTQVRSLAARADRENRILAEARWVMGRTDWDRRVSRLLSPESTYLVGDEILRPEFFAQTWEPHSDLSAPRVVTIMSGGLYKGMETLLRAASHIKKLRRAPLDWVVVGMDHTSTIVRLASAFTEINPVSVGISLVGRKGPKDLARLLRGANLYCQVSHIENSPNSLCEAMVVGVPSVASFAGGTSSLIQDGREGLLVQDGDSFSLAGAIIELLDDPARAKSMGQAAKLRARKRHDPERVAGQIMEAYQRILRETP